MSTTTPPPQPTFASKAKKLAKEVSSLASVGAVAFVVDFGLYNLLRVSVLEGKTITAQVVAATVATVVAWIGTRYFTYRDRTAVTKNAWQEFQAFGLVNLVGLGISTGCLALTHYGFNLTSLTADNISKFGGIVLGTMFRWSAYRWWLFPEETSPEAAIEELVAPPVHRAAAAHEDSVPVKPTNGLSTAHQSGAETLGAQTSRGH